jgi:uncharacterized protein YqeY
MTLQARIEADIRDAMRAGETLRRDTLRMLIAALKNKRIEEGEDLDDGVQLAVLTHSAKTRADSAQQYDDAGRPELAEKERAEIAIIQAYLPAQLDEGEARAIVQGKIAELGLSSKKEMGQLMKAVMADHKGTVDGKLVQRLAGELLA